MVHTTHLGGNAKDIEVASIGHGLMLMTWVANPIPDEQAFEAIKDGVDAAGGAKVLLNSGEFYGPNLSTANLELLARFYKKYPEYVDKTILCVKGGINEGLLSPDASETNLRRSLNKINSALQNTKRVDIYECARVDRNFAIEDTTRVLAKLSQEGLFDHIGMSECSAETLSRANSVHPIASVEIEISPWSYEEETKKVIAFAGQNNIAVLAYSPLGRGFLAGQFKRREDIPEGDMRLHFARFSAENFPHNLELVDRIKAIASNRNPPISSGQLCLAWVRSLGQHIIPIPGSSKSTRTLENLAASDITLTSAEKKAIDELLSAFVIKGERYTHGVEYLWG